jgi:hypothetical protein
MEAMGELSPVTGREVGAIDRLNGHSDVVEHQGARSVENASFPIRLLL